MMGTHDQLTSQVHRYGKSAIVVLVDGEKKGSSRVKTAGTRYMPYSRSMSTTKRAPLDGEGEVAREAHGKVARWHCSSSPQDYTERGEVPRITRRRHAHP